MHVQTKLINAAAVVAPAAAAAGRGHGQNPGDRHGLLRLQFDIALYIAVLRWLAHPLCLMKFWF